MSETLTIAFIAAMYLATIMGMILFLAFVCKVGDLGFMLLGWLDQKLQDSHMKSLQKKKKEEVSQEKFPFAYCRPGVAKSGSML